jgi:hypothetical protein
LLFCKEAVGSLESAACDANRIAPLRNFRSPKSRLFKIFSKDLEKPQDRKTDLALQKILKSRKIE